MRCRLRTLMAMVGLIACVIGIGLGLQRRAHALRQVAAYHEQAAAFLYTEKVGEICPDGISEQDRLERIIRARGAGARIAYEAARYHEGLADKYAGAARHPWQWVEFDPTRPPGADPEFTFDPNLGALDDPDSATGFQQTGFAQAHDRPHLPAPSLGRPRQYGA